MKGLNKLNSQLLELCDAHKPLPPIRYETRGVWLDLPPLLCSRVREGGAMCARGGLHAIEHAMIALAPLGVACESSDLGCQCTRRQVKVD
ncbi:MAG: hypothetical protein SGPRY_002239 [Prymnesium sp.]